MKITVLGALTLLAIAGACPVQAGDPVASTPSAWDWDGPYFGVNGGGSWGKSQWTATAPNLPSGSADFGTEGGVAGLTFGYDWQRGHLVYGIATDIDWAGIDGSSSSAICAGNPTVRSECRVSDSFIGTLRGRFGYDFGPWLPYVTAGAAIGNFEGHFLSTGGGAAPIDIPIRSETALSYAVGVGGEYQFARGWSWSVEYLFEDFGKASCTNKCGGTALLPGATLATSLSTNTVRIGLNRRF